MKIESYTVNTASARRYIEVNRQSTVVEVGAKKDKKDDGLNLSVVAQRMMAQRREEFSWMQAGGASAVRNRNIAATPDDLRISLLETMLRALTGKSWRFSRVADFIAERLVLAQQSSGNTAVNAGPMYETTTTETLRYENEQMGYSASGVVKTADGRTIHVEAHLRMSREFMEYTNVSTEALCKPIDPLVIRYGGDAASLTERKYQFDLDMDGTLDNISFAGKGSGFLALDKNGDGKINNGSELFGPASGNGFNDLRAYDSDGNGWIDANDEVFDQLLVWSKDGNGKDVLYSLKDIGVGAIYLGETATDFKMTDSAGNTQGAMRATSFYLKENGDAGFLHHIDIMA